MVFKNEIWKFLRDSSLNSYSQIFFSKNKVFAIFILLATFLIPGIGIWGLLGVIFTNFLAIKLGFHKQTILDGLFGINSLLVILGLSVFFKVNLPFIFVFFAINIFTLILSVGIANLLARFNLPFLAFPFIIAIWITFYVMNSYTNLEVDEGTTFFLNELYKIGGFSLLEFYDKFENLPIPGIIIGYFKSLAAIVFQSNWIAGLLIAIGLLIASRISFSLSIIGYLIGYLYFIVVGENIQNLQYGYIGFNFILFAIAVGAFYFVPKRNIHIAVIVLTPVLGLLITGLSGFLSIFGLPVFALPFMIMTILVIYVLNFTYKQNIFPKVVYQTYSPEKNLYNYNNYYERFGSNIQYLKIGLPFFGKWKIWQGQNGKHTHKGDWENAWDFVIVDKNQNTFKDDGHYLNDYYSYNAPVTAPADGKVVNIIDGVEDNIPGEINMNQNWGNTIVLQHTDFLYSQLSHLKQNTFKVKIGEQVTKGEQIASLGNSGRSPQPHLHFQLQTTPYVGSKTLKYPLSYYINYKTDNEEFETFNYPKEDQIISDIKINKVLKKAFKLIPGMVFNVTSTHENIENSEWEIHTDAYNLTYIYCTASKSYAYFVNDGTILYFTSFEGNKNSLLYYFYLSAFKIFIGDYKSVEIQDTYPIHILFNGVNKYLQDFIAPYYQYCKANYLSKLEEFKIDENSFEINSVLTKKVTKKLIETIDFQIIGNSKSIQKIVVNSDRTSFEININLEKNF
ncbi:MAG: urea transporter [Bacteroidota bacterium]